MFAIPIRRAAPLGIAGQANAVSLIRHPTARSRIAFAFLLSILTGLAGCLRHPAAGDGGEGVASTDAPLVSVSAFAAAGTVAFDRPRTEGLYAPQARAVSTQFGLGDTQQIGTSSPRRVAAVFTASNGRRAVALRTSLRSAQDFNDDNSDVRAEPQTNEIFVQWLDSAAGPASDVQVVHRYEGFDSPDLLPGPTFFETDRVIWLAWYDFEIDRTTGEASYYPAIRAAPYDDTAQRWLTERTVTLQSCRNLGVETTPFTSDNVRAYNIRLGSASLETLLYGTPGPKRTPPLVRMTERGGLFISALVCARPVSSGRGYNVSLAFGQLQHSAPAGASSVTRLVDIDPVIIEYPPVADFSVLFDRFSIAINERTFDRHVLWRADDDQLRHRVYSQSDNFPHLVQAPTETIVSARGDSPRIHLNPRSTYEALGVWETGYSRDENGNLVATIAAVPFFGGTWHHELGTTFDNYHASFAFDMSNSGDGLLVTVEPAPGAPALRDNLVLHYRRFSFPLFFDPSRPGNNGWERDPQNGEVIARSIQSRPLRGGRTFSNGSFPIFYAVPSPLRLAAGANSVALLSWVSDRSFGVEGSDTGRVFAMTPPLAAFSYATDALTVRFDASVSRALSTEAAISRYEWDFDADGQIDAAGSEPSARYSYAATGTYNVVLTVIDSTGARQWASERVIVSGVANAPPVARINFTPNNPTPGNAANFSALASTDDGTIVTYEWDFQNDGTIDAAGIEVQHSFATSGDYTVRLRVQDNLGAIGVTTVAVRVGEGPPPPPPPPPTTGWIPWSTPSNPLIPTGVSVFSVSRPSIAVWAGADVIAYSLRNPANNQVEIAVRQWNGGWQPMGQSLAAPMSNFNGDPILVQSVDQRLAIVWTASMGEQRAVFAAFYDGVGNWQPAWSGQALNWDALASAYDARAVFAPDGALAVAWVESGLPRLARVSATTRSAYGGNATPPGAAALADQVAIAFTPQGDPLLVWSEDVVQPSERTRRLRAAAVVNGSWVDRAAGLASDRNGVRARGLTLRERPNAGPVLAWSDVATDALGRVSPRFDQMLLQWDGTQWQPFGVGQTSFATLWIASDAVMRVDGAVQTATLWNLSGGSYARADIDRADGTQANCGGSHATDLTYAVAGAVPLRAEPGDDALRVIWATRAGSEIALEVWRCVP